MVFGVTRTLGTFSAYMKNVKNLSRTGGTEMIPNDMLVFCLDIIGAAVIIWIGLTEIAIEFKRFNDREERK